MIDDKYLDEVERRIDSHVRQWEYEQNLTPAQRAARRVIADLLYDPEVWATHGCPSDAKLERIGQRIADELESFAALGSISKEKT